MSYKMIVDSIGRSGDENRVRLTLVAMNANAMGGIGPGASGGAMPANGQQQVVSDVIGGNLTLDWPRDDHPEAGEVFELSLKRSKKSS